MLCILFSFPLITMYTVIKLYNTNFVLNLNNQLIFSKFLSTKFQNDIYNTKQMILVVHKMLTKKMNSFEIYLLLFVYSYFPD